MTYSRAEIEEDFKEAVRRGASHVLIACDSFDHDNYPIFVMPGNDPKTAAPTNGDRIDECYRVSLGWTTQRLEQRAWHWEWEPLTGQCALETEHEAHVWEGFVTDPEKSMETAFYACQGLVLPQPYLPPDLYNDLQEFLLGGQLTRLNNRTAVLLAGRLGQATGASELRRRAREKAEHE